MKTSQSITRAFIIFILTISVAQAQPSRVKFSGPYFGLEMGRQHLIGGSLVNGTDVLQEDMRAVVSLGAGLRVQFAGGFVIGGEVGVGRTNGDLSLSNTVSQLQIDYSNDAQHHLGVQLGHTIGRDWLVFGYLAEVTRNFDVTIRQAQRTFAQNDEQGSLRFGTGVDFNMKAPLLLRATLGSARADFGDRKTNLAVGRKLEASFGVIMQF